MASSKRKDSKGRILRTGESQRKDKTYMYRWTDKQKKRHCIYDNTLEGLRKQEEQIQLEILQGINRDSITLNQMIERYFATKSSLAASTYENYLYYYKHSIKNDFIGSMKVSDIKKSDLLLFFSRKSNEDGLANGTIHILNKILHPTFQLAMDDDIIKKNPADGCMKEYQQDSEVKYALSLEQENEFLQRILLRPRMKHFYPFFAIMLYTGIRISEAIGLTWDDVDMTNRTIDINHQLQYRRINGKMKLYCIDDKKGKADTKTKCGKRIIPMNQVVYNLFVEQRKEWFRIKKDPDFEIDGYKNFVFLSNRTGRNLYPANVRKMLNRIVKMNDERNITLPHISPHILRHTTCTRYAESGMDIKTNQYLMGHSDIKTTIKVYNHADLERVKRELEKYNSWQETYTNFYTKLS